MNGLQSPPDSMNLHNLLRLNIVNVKVVVVFCKTANVVCARILTWKKGRREALLRIGEAWPTDIYEVLALVKVY